jgi:hypothetical protein
MNVIFTTPHNDLCRQGCCHENGLLTLLYKLGVWRDERIGVILRLRAAWGGRSMVDHKSTWHTPIIGD